ncbi:hypothetical protein [Rothia nasimurium]|uniref:hypothetical protein n=1 Tax=Rothia nasimurium TaxID=85336 RepID=UPI001F2B0BA5|nr:hypothetical protein [Rothia nasimurium]
MTDLAKKLATATAKKESNGGGAARTESAFRKPASTTRKFTFNIDEGIYQQLRKQAFEQERDMTSIINEILEKNLL